MARIRLSGTVRVPGGRLPIRLACIDSGKLSRETPDCVEQVPAQMGEGRRSNDMATSESQHDSTSQTYIVLWQVKQD